MRCEVEPVVTSRIGHQLYAVVSVNAFESVEPSLVKRVTTMFEDENEAARLARRKRNWIGDIGIVEGDISSGCAMVSGRIF
jgi:hypothetical protein